MYHKPSGTSLEDTSGKAGITNRMGDDRVCPGECYAPQMIPFLCCTIENKNGRSADGEESAAMEVLLRMVLSLLAFGCIGVNDGSGGGNVPNQAPYVCSFAVRPDAYKEMHLKTGHVPVVQPSLLLPTMNLGSTANLMVKDTRAWVQGATDYWVGDGQTRITGVANRKDIGCQGPDDATGCVSKSKGTANAQTVSKCTQMLVLLGIHSIADFKAGTIKSVCASCFLHQTGLGYTTCYRLFDSCTIPMAKEIWNSKPVQIPWNKGKKSKPKPRAVGEQDWAGHPGWKIKTPMQGRNITYRAPNQSNGKQGTLYRSRTKAVKAHAAAALDWIGGR
jgi:hypothetical protein